MGSLNEIDHFLSELVSCENQVFSAVYTVYKLYAVWILPFLFLNAAKHSLLHVI